MNPVEFVKALGVAILVMALDLACAFLSVSIWAWLTGPHPGLGVTDPRVIAVSTLSTRICGPMLFALFVWIFQRKRPDRNRYAFALAVFGFYMLLDWAMVAFQGMLEPAALMTAGLKLIGALAGAWLAKAR
jgi:hypothetical protein